MGYGPRLTAKQRAALLAEIKAFDKEATLARIEREAVGGRDVDAYENWRNTQPGGEEPVQANPDLLSDDCPQPWGINAELADPLGLSKREKEAWDYCERAGLSREEAAQEMGVKPETIKAFLRTARRKMRGTK